MDRARQEQLLSALEADHRAAELDPADLAMLDYAVKLTDDPAGIDRVDVERLAAAGFDERAIHDICAIAAYFNFVNRTAHGLGVELEPRRDADRS